ncbi:hypothetical protein VKT23_011948 [Stygiomarasmius scandens]|uniref:Ankyrin repeat protein n=1 Tax=Marasmiellus scandens TaxID=2682957 RepID=A0ABR1JCY4_9AGAR
MVPEQFRLLTVQLFAADIEEELLDILFQVAGEVPIHIVRFFVEEGKTATFKAVLQSNLNIATSILEKKQDANWRDRFFHAAACEKYLNVAVKGGHLDVVKFLVENEADHTKSFTYEGRALLHIAAENNDLDLIKILLNKGINIDEMDSYDKTALYYAVRGGGLETVRLLLKNGAKASFRYGMDTAVHAAARGGHLDIIKLLAQSGADCNSKQVVWNSTPLHNAAENGHVHVIKFFLEMGIDVNSQDGVNRTAVHYAASGKLDAVKFLVEEKAVAVDTTDVWGRTAPSKAAENGHLDVLKWFFDTGLVINTRMSLYLATANNHVDIVKFLIENGADVNAMAFGETPLHAAAYRGNSPIVKFLIHNGANVNAKTNIGTTVLNMASAQKIIQFLKDNGAR